MAINPVMMQYGDEKFPEIYSDYKSLKNSISGGSSSNVIFEGLPMYGRIYSIPDKMEKKDYTPAMGMISLAVLNGPEDLRDVFSAYKQIKNKFPKPVTFHSGYDNKIAQHPFSFFRGTILNDYLNPSSKECPNPKAAAWLIKQDKTLWDTKLGNWVQKKCGIKTEKFTTEIKEKGLSEYYTLNTNVEELESATKSIENVKTFATTFLLIMLAISAVVLFVINMINIRERKYEIGVFRTIGVSKFKLTLQFALEILIVSVVMLGIGAVCGSFLAKPVGNMLLENEIQSVQEETEQISNNFGKGGPMDMNFGGTVNVQTIDTINAVVDITVVAQLLGIGLALMLVSSLASMISIQRFSPLTILKERS